LQACAAVVALLLAPVANAQSVVTLYENDFESPSTTDCANGWGGHPNGGTFPVDYSTASHPIIQNKTVDRLCVSPTGVSGYYYDSNP
jgi:hypothetical protein